jgi:transcriptional regulator with XRE-family HTH domain
MSSAPRKPRPNKHRSPLGERVLALRLERGLTQIELATDAGVSRSHLAKIETGGDVAGRETLQALAVFFDVSMDYLQTGTHPSPSPQVGRFVQDEEELAILDLWEAIPPAERPRVARMLRAAAADPAKMG